jgi:hypothetical protein
VGQRGRAFDSPETNMAHFLQRLDQVSATMRVRVAVQKFFILLNKTGSHLD